MKVKGFEPIGNKDCTKLILGTLPSVISIKQQKYYANPNNAFWRMIKTLFHLKEAETYAQCCAAFKQNKIALWDVYASGIRKGSTDSNIEEATYNNFLEFFNKCRHVTTVYCNGRTAEKAARRNPYLVQKEIVYLPSTSPAYTKSFDYKLKDWKIIMIK